MNRRLSSAAAARTPRPCIVHAANSSAAIIRIRLEPIDLVYHRVQRLQEQPVHQSCLAFATLLLIMAFSTATSAPSDVLVSKPRARDLGVPFDGTPGDLNAITDVAGVLVGHTTLISGEGKLQQGKGP